MKITSALVLCVLAALSTVVQAGEFVAAPRTPATLALSTPIDQACASYLPADFESDEPPGTTRLSVYVTVAGTVSRLNVRESSGSIDLDQAATQCIGALGVMYEPATVGPLKVASWTEIRINWGAILKERGPKHAAEPFFKF
jgi:Gram-negative bacterial TonB protein C-terminal